MTIDREHLKSLQDPMKAQYREDPTLSRITLHATGSLGEGITCSVDTGRAIAEAGLGQTLQHSPTLTFETA